MNDTEYHNRDRIAVTSEQIELAKHWYRVRARHPLPGRPISPPLEHDEVEVLEAI